MSARPLRARFAAIGFYTALIVCFLLLLHGILVARHEAQRGIWFPGDALPPATDLATPLGTTVSLEQYEDDAALTRALDAAQGMGIGWLRQELPWDAIEPARGEYEWERWDRVVQAAHERGFALVLVLNRTPEWARPPSERANPFAPPQNHTDFVRFARAAALRYGDAVLAWQVWDEPNLMPHWGTEVFLNPEAYALFLAATAPAIREADPGALVVTAGLGPTLEPGGFNMSEMRFLQGLYDAGAAPHFDAVALKPYGFWTGATERVYDEGALGFDRPVLVREVMQRNGDAETPIWFVEGGWATLPDGWAGDPAPWGSHHPKLQGPRLEAALRRAALEWPWVQRLALQPLQPEVGPRDPRVGLALLDDADALTPLGETTAQMGTRFFNGPMGAQEQAAWETVGRPALLRYDWAVVLVGGMMAVLGAGWGWHVGSLPWAAWAAWQRRRPEWLQIALLVAVALLFYTVDNRTVALLIYGVLGILVAVRLDLGLTAVAFAIPFFLQAKAFPPLQFSMVELLLLLCAAVWVARVLFLGEAAPLWTLSPKTETSYVHRLSSIPFASLRTGVHRLRLLFWPRDSLDWAILLFVVWAAASVYFAHRFGVASREFRVVVAESVAWFWLLRRTGLSEAQRWRLVDALVLATALVALYGLYQWLFTGNIITAEGVRRIRGVYGSPNNLSLLMGRVLPILAAIVLIAPRSRRRLAYGAATLPIAVCLFLTFSRGALLLGMPAALLWLAWWGGRRARLAGGALVVAALLALLPFVGTERIASAANLEGGTWLVRFHLWKASLAMVQDYPLLGVGLDNFLYVYDAYRLPQAWREPDLSHPHQIVLHFWLALGLPGLVFLFWQQAAFWRLWCRKIGDVPLNTLARGLLLGLGASMVATLAHGLIDNSYFLVDLAFIWMMTMALIGELPNGQRELESASPAHT